MLCAKEALSGAETQGWVQETLEFFYGWLPRLACSGAPQGLGTSTSDETKGYFADLDFHRKTFEWQGARPPPPIPHCSLIMRQGAAAVAPRHPQVLEGRT